MTELATGGPAGHVELGGPEKLGVDAWARRLFALTGDERTVVGDPHARYFGTELHDGELTPGNGARIGKIDFETWFAMQRGSAELRIPTRRGPVLARVHMAGPPLMLRTASRYARQVGRGPARSAKRSTTNRPTSSSRQAHGEPSPSDRSAVVVPVALHARQRCQATAAPRLWFENHAGLKITLGLRPRPVPLTFGA